METEHCGAVSCGEAHFYRRGGTRKWCTGEYAPTRSTVGPVEVTERVLAIVEQYEDREAIAVTTTFLYEIASALEAALAEQERLRRIEEAAQFVVVAWPERRGGGFDRLREALASGSAAEEKCRCDRREEPHWPELGCDVASGSAAEEKRGPFGFPST